MNRGRCHLNDEHERPKCKLVNISHVIRRQTRRNIKRHTSTRNEGALDIAKGHMNIQKAHRRPPQEQSQALEIKRNPQAQTTKTVDTPQPKPYAQSTNTHAPLLAPSLVIYLSYLTLYIVSVVRLGYD